MILAVQRVNFTGLIVFRNCGRRALAAEEEPLARRTRWISSGSGTSLSSATAFGAIISSLVSVLLESSKKTVTCSGLKKTWQMVPSTLQLSGRRPAASKGYTLYFLAIN